MKKLLLTSTGFKKPKIVEEFLKLVNKEPEQIKVLFIPTASRTKEETCYVNKLKEELEQLGIWNIFEFNCDREISDDKLKDIDVIYVCGGNTFYLLHKVREVGLDNQIIQLVENGAVYVGVSAGSILAGPNIEIAGPWDENDVNLKDLTALNLTDKIVSPHYVDDEKKIIDSFKKKYGEQVIPISDEQALLLNGKKETLL